MLEFSMLFISLAIFITLIKFFIGNTVWEKLLALNLISVKVILLICIYAVYKKNPMLLDIGIIYGIIGFLTVIILTRFVIKGGRQK
ncbi:multicomponent Na+:H+ antiporter subunit F [Acetoanaerobium pronyense]|uniref:Multicomponent Na+:H+ antiporter subunit F n=1 Tax=Acetoanaerobium pronyense TaxID=1482736 RepID=A0ABS4KJC8_9FIRM|nr:monovalent cation/H+ antiporter complex subunit F [Acetoanaerobium pronyense]MBP2027897.1 multicomponent Na+:H+ antiporter subunit F [Acetoanaerobium pronyense]